VLDLVAGQRFPVKAVALGKDDGTDDPIPAAASAVEARETGAMPDRDGGDNSGKRC